MTPIPTRPKTNTRNNISSECNTLTRNSLPAFRVAHGSRAHLHMFGKPDELESDRQAARTIRGPPKGGGSTSTYPFETWWYRNIEGIGSDIQIEFVDPSGTGEYRIARSPD